MLVEKNITMKKNFLFISLYSLLQISTGFTQITSIHKYLLYPYKLTLNSVDSILLVNNIKDTTFDKNKYAQLFISIHCNYQPSCINDTIFGLKPMSEVNMKKNIFKLINDTDTCFCNNEYAQIVFKRRLELIDSCYQYNRYQKISDDIKCIINNLDIISGNKTESDGDYFGEIWFNPIFFNIYSDWFKQNKKKLCYDYTTKLLYVMHFQ